MPDINTADAVKSGTANPGAETPRLPSLKEFFENKAPGKAVTVADALTQIANFSPPKFRLKTPVLDLHCEPCGGLRSFVAQEYDGEIRSGSYSYFVHIRFRCRNCERSVKLYSLLVHLDSDVCTVYKFGELPEFGPPTPSKVISLIRDEREYYVKGRRSENQGLGIAAFAYYRRVVENQKDRIFGEVIKASKKVHAPEKMIGELEEAMKETQFSKAIETIKPGVPQALLIDGHNPLTLLHNALSEGLHAQTDEECLELATSIRVVLSDLVERMASVLTDHAELKTAVIKLIEVKAKKTNTKE